MKVIRLFIVAMTMFIMFSGMTVAIENPHEKITITGEEEWLTPIPYPISSLLLSLG